MADLFYLLAEGELFHSFQLEGLGKSLSLVVHLKGLLSLPSLLRLVLFCLTNPKVLDHLLQVLLLLGVDQIHLSDACLPAFLNDRRQFLSELLLLQSLEPIVDYHHELLSLGLMKIAYEFLLGDLFDFWL